MKRIVLIGAAVAGLFTAGITAVASAATSTKYVSVTVTKYEKESKTVKANPACSFTLTTVAPAGTTGVTAGSATGTQYGNTFCKGGLTTGTTRTVYAEDDAGDLTGQIQHWFPDGTVYGTFSLTAGSNGPPTATSFGSASYSGTVKLTGASGPLKGTTGTATMKCSTMDSLHYACTEKLHLTQTVTVLVPVKTTERVKVG